MALPSLTLRNTKGSALTYTEADNNFTNLSTATIGVIVGSTTTSLALNDQLTLTAGANVTLTGNSATKTVTIAASGGSSGIAAVKDDTAPRLGGDLDIQTFNIVTTVSNRSINLVPNGTGDVYLQTDTTVIGDINTDAVLTTYGSGKLTLNTDFGNNSGIISIANGVNGQITITPNGSGNVIINPPTGYVSISGNKLPGGAGTANYFLKTDGAGQTSWSTLTTATAAVVGGIKVGSNLTITGDGTLSGVAAYSLTTATAVALGGVKIGSGISITGDGTISASASYTLTTATSTALGGVKIGSNVTVASDGTISVAAPGLTTFTETVYAYGNSGVLTWTPNFTNGTVQTITLTGSLTLSAFTSPVSGQTITFIITQDATGSRTLTSTMKFAGGFKTLTTTASAIDILTVSYIGTTYYASLSRGYA